MKTAICAVIKDERLLIGEWIAHHLAVGFDIINVYDNGSSDGTLEYLAAAGRHYDVRPVSWDTNARDFQTKAYEAGIARLRSEADWILFIDVDEYFIPDRDGDVKSFLGSFSEEAHGVAVSELFYGSSGIVQRPSGLISRCYTRRAPDEFGPNRHVKSFVRPGHVQGITNPHHFSLMGGYLGADGKPVDWAGDGLTQHVQGTDIARINHYFTRSRQDWNDKLRRGYLDGTVRDPSEFDFYDRNEIFDDAATRYCSQVEDIIVKIEDFKPISYVMANPGVMWSGKGPRRHYFEHGREKIKDRERKLLGIRSAG